MPTERLAHHEALLRDKAVCVELGREVLAEVHGRAVGVERDRVAAFVIVVVVGLFATSPQHRTQAGRVNR